MGLNFVGQLLSFILTPLGLLSLVLGPVFLFQASHSRRGAWFLFTLCCFAATLAKFQDQFVLEPPALVFPLEQLRNMGRPLTIITMGMLLVLGLQHQNSWRLTLIPRAMKYLMAVQAVIIFKTMLYGSITFAFLTAFTIGGVVLMIRRGPARWVQNNQEFHLAAWSLAMVSVIFVTVNLYQAVIDPFPITFVHGRFLGTTGNPQHAAALLATIMPCLMFLVESQQNWNLRRISWIVVVALALGALFLTGSRAGLLMGVTTILFFYRRNWSSLLRLGILIGAIFGVLWIFQDQLGITFTEIFATSADRALSTDNSRQLVWSALWSNFQAYPIFGTPLNGDRLMGYGESSWLGTAAALGLAGLIPLLLFGFASIRMMVQLYLIGNQHPAYFHHASMVVGGLVAIFIGSIFEAFLLGNLAFPVLALFFYLSLGQYLLDAVEQKTLNLDAVVADAKTSSRHRQIRYPRPATTRRLGKPGSIPSL